MKKILLATTVMAMATGYAAADVKVSGSARMGITSTVVAGKAKAVFSSRVRIQFDGSGTTDGGLSFGASMRADQNGGNADGKANGDSTVFISGAFGKLTMGDVAGGAGDELVGQISGVGYTGLGDTNEIGFLPNTATAVRYDYTSGALSVALGASQTTAVTTTVGVAAVAPATTGTITNAADNKSIAVKYAGSNFSVALSYETVTGNSLVSAKGSYTMGPATITVKAAQADKVYSVTPAGVLSSVKGKTEAGISLDYVVMPALTVTAFYTDHANTKNAAKGLGASYDLGGGASVKGGIINDGKPGAKTLGEVGVTMSF